MRFAAAIASKSSAVMVTAAAVLGGACSQDSGIPVKLSGPPTLAVADAHCQPRSGSVVVTGTLTDKLLALVGSGVSATVYDSAGSQIGMRLGPLAGLHSGQSLPFRFTVSVSGVPASCTVSWGAGPLPGL